MGLFTFGGALGTQTGVVFAAGSVDHAFRAFDSRTGRLLFEADLMGSGASTPISYRGKDGRQYVVISSEAPAKPGGFYGGVTAFVLPVR
jgi:quinoprotein glucose dehydrogenase